MITYEKYMMTVVGSRRRPTPIAAVYNSPQVERICFWVRFRMGPYLAVAR